MACDVREAILEEIALEGLDGITVQALWLRLSERKGFTLCLDERSRRYLWQCVLGFIHLEFFLLPKPRPDLISYNRFHYIDPETKHFLETEDIPEDIYPVHLVMENGIMGSCVHYKTRTNISNTITERKPTLEEAQEKYGNRLVIVASQAVRTRVLVGADNSQAFPFSDMMYGVLERIGRARSNGEASNGTMSLQVFKQSNKSLFYIVKKMRLLGVIRKQRLCTIKKSSNVKLCCILYHLDRFFWQVGSRSLHELMNIALYLSEKPQQMAEVIKVKNDLKIYDTLKRVTRKVGNDGDRYFVFIDLPFREVHPNAKPKEYLMKNGGGEKSIRHIKMIQTLEDVRAGLHDEEELPSSDDDEGDPPTPPEGLLQALPELEYSSQLDEPQVHQILRLIQTAGSRGLSMSELAQVTGIMTLQARRLIRILERTNFINSLMLDKGRQKIIMYIAKESVAENIVHQSVTEEIRKLTDGVPFIRKEEISKRYENYQQARAKKKEALLLKLTEAEPSEEQVADIRKELTALEEARPHNQQSLQTDMETIKELRGSSVVQVQVKEVDVLEVTDKYGERLVGMKRFGTVLTESHVRRANWILEVLSAIKVVETFKMLKLLRNREKEMGLPYLMDQKSQKRIIYALIEEGRLNSYTLRFTMNERVKELTVISMQDTGPNTEPFLRMVEEAKLKHFSITKEEIKKLHQLKANQSKASVKVLEKIPQSARDSIRFYQEYRRKIAMQTPPMKFNRGAGYKYGLLPKFLRIQAVHQYLFHLCYCTHSNKVRQSAPEIRQGAEQRVGQSAPQETGMDISQTLGGANVDKIDMSEKCGKGEGMTWTEVEPYLYVDELSWRRYCPPIPVHAGYGPGWCLVSDVLLIMPVCLFCQIVNVCYNIEGLLEILEHPERRLYPVMNLPFHIAQQLLHSRKYIQCFLDTCAYMAEMGILTFGREVFKDKDEQFVYINRNVSLLDTRESLKGYNKTHAPSGHDFPTHTFHLDTFSDLHNYWEFLQIVALGSNLGHKSLLQDDLDDTVSYQEISLKDACAPRDPSNLTDTGIIPGDRRAAAGLDSSLFVHTHKNWTFRTFTETKRMKNYPKKLKTPSHTDKSKPKLVGEWGLKGRERLVVSTDKDKPLMIQKVHRDGYKGNKGGKGIKRSQLKKATDSETHRFFRKAGGKVRRRRTISKVPNPPGKRKRAYKGDSLDAEIHRNRNKLRVLWTKKEDSMILMCRLASLIMDNKRKTTVIMNTHIRDLLHEKCGRISRDKTSGTIHRRVIFVLKNPLTEANLLLYYQEALQDEFVVQNFVNKNFILTDEETVPKFRILVDYLVNKFKTLDLQKCSLPASLDLLTSNYTIQYIGKLTDKKTFTDPASKAEICHDVLRTILHSAVLLQDKQGRTHEMFKLLTQYPDALLCNVIRELRNDGMFVINKKNYSKESLNQLHSGLGLRNFKVSQRYLFAFKQRYLSPMFEESASLLDAMLDKFTNEEEEDQYVTMPFDCRPGQNSLLYPMILNGTVDIKMELPDELVIVDMKGFYNFPWGRGKQSTTPSNTKADKTLRDIHEQKTRGKKQEQQGVATQSNSEEVTKDIGQGFEKEQQGDSVQSDSEIILEVDSSGKMTVKNGSPKSGKKHDAAEHLGADEQKKDGNLIASTSPRRVSDEIVLEVRNGELTAVNDKEVDVDVEMVENKAQEAGEDSVTTADNRKVPQTHKGPDNVEMEDSYQGQPMGDHIIPNNQAADKVVSNEDDDIDETHGVQAQEFTHLITPHGVFVIPKPEEDNTQIGPVGSSSSIASRTFVCLRRAEECSFEDIRVFNAQDNFVVKSCLLKMKISDKKNREVGNEGVFVKTVKKDEHNDDTNGKPVAPPENDDKNVHNISEHKRKLSESEPIEGKRHGRKLVGGDNKGDENQAGNNKAKEKIQDCPNNLSVDTAVMKTLWSNLNKLLPFQVDLMGFWTELGERQVATETVATCHHVYEVIEAEGELGIQHTELARQCGTLTDYKKVVSLLLEHSMVVSVGICHPCYVALVHARPWVIHAYRNLRGRGLHAEEENLPNLPLSLKDPDPIIDATPMKIPEEDRIQLPSGTEVPLIPLSTDQEDRIALPQDIPISLVPLAGAMDSSYIPLSHTSEVSMEKHLSEKSTLLNANKVGMSGWKKKKIEISGNKCSSLGYLSSKEKQVVDAKELVKANQNEMEKDFDESKSNQSEKRQPTESSQRKRKNSEKEEGEPTAGKQSRMEGGPQHGPPGSPRSIKAPGSQVGENLTPGKELGVDCDSRRTRATKKRRHLDDTSSTEESPSVKSTYDKVHLVLMPWRKPEGGINRPVLKMMLESVLLYLMTQPGCLFSALVKRYLPYLQPMVLHNIIDVRKCLQSLILECLGCVRREFLKCRRSTLFSLPSTPVPVETEGDDTAVYLIPTENCVERLGQFALTFYPGISWPHTSYANDEQST
ncbi:general transcription factor 3C polypeptide 1-like isoform X3 [Mya arenaria]|uniref:general transcription factor 3C polypeptide 1-like isoform X3 n=1 Tax=Mya arenaria TaxID=6604 RepID=UPI0022E1C12B|nr:general transcription factor 3C polypeptide 1-like isoform X3 [Mya arenaria]